MPRLVGIDTETSGLDGTRHVPYEFGGVVRDLNADGTFEETYLHHWIDLSDNELQQADPGALKINRYYERAFADEIPRASGLAIASAWARETTGAYLVGANISFDAGMLRRFMLNRGFPHAWHHRLIDVESMAMALFNLQTPPGLSDLKREFKIEQDPTEEHTALSDIKVTMQVFDELRRHADDGTFPDWGSGV